MRRVLIAAVLVAGVGLLAQASLRITTFNAQIDVLSTGVLDVVETISVRFETPHHGIYREIPYSYRRSSGERLTIGLTVNSVRLDGGPVPFERSRSSGNLVLKIGEPDRTIIGDRTYEISYSVSRALLFGNEEYIQLYWNVTGNDWPIPIDTATARVGLPESVAPDSVPTISYVGYSGETTRGDPAAIGVDGRLVFAAVQLVPGEGLTIDVAIPRAASGIAAPTTLQRVVWFLSDNKYAFLPVLTLIGMLLLWWRKGKDPSKGTIAPRFEAPKGIRAGEAGVLIDDRADLRDISAMVIDLAVKGFIRIVEVRPEENGLGDRLKGLIGRSVPADYEFVKLRDGDGALTNVERVLLDGIFDDAHPEERTLSSMENEFYKVLPALKSGLYGRLIKNGYYASNPERVRTHYFGIGALGGIAGVALGVVLGSLYLGIAVALCGLVVLAFSPIMPRKTEKGGAALRDLLGLSEYIRRAEVDRMEFHDAPEKSPELFEKLLPYAMALNLTSIWTRQFEGLFERPPDWYSGTSPVFHGHLFAISMLHLASGMQRTFVSAPRTSSGGRSAWSGGGSFGGGFSGGGFGGGGGGGW